MEHDPILKDIDEEYVEASAEAFRLGRRPRIQGPLETSDRPTLLARLQNPELRTTEVPTDPLPARRR